VKRRRDERDLFFWTARKSLKLTFMLSITIYFVINLAQGRITGHQELLDLVQEIAKLLQ
jgi:hypothetical protein